MHKDVKIMIELQRYWNKILEVKENIARANKNIDFWKNDLNSLQKELIGLEGEIKNLKNKIKQNELELADHDEKLKKLQQRKNSLQSEKELKAVAKEIEIVKNDQSKLEEILISLMDEQDVKEQKFAKLSAEMAEKNPQVEKDLTLLRNNIKNFENIIADNQEKFDSLSLNLSPAIKLRYVKLINSKKDGKGIGEIIGEICGACNFQVPASLAHDATKSDKLSVCTNCGRYIYKQ